MKLQELAAQLGAELRGDGSVEDHRGARHRRRIAIRNHLRRQPKYAGLARTTQAAAVLVAPDFPEIPTATLRLANPYLAFAQALGIFYQPPQLRPGVHPTAVVDPPPSSAKMPTSAPTP
jgi:UDP-3-O-[3-hydroxymyristoyl] glucosamine N-acyltransferase